MKPVWGAEGGLYEPPVLQCGSAVCIEVLVSEVVSASAKVTVDFHPIQVMG